MKGLIKTFKDLGKAFARRHQTEEDLRPKRVLLLSRYLVDISIGKNNEFSKNNGLSRLAAESKIRGGMVGRPKRNKLIV